jgi:DNA-directed RNA polymerase subunit RPC12/RpoP
MGELYYVCGQCGHTVSSPELPDACEGCRAPYTSLRGYRTLAEAEADSQDQLDARRDARGPTASELHNRASHAEL